MLSAVYGVLALIGFAVNRRHIAPTLTAPFDQSESEPAVQFGVGHRARFRQRQEHVVLGVGHRNHALPVAGAAGLPGDVGDVEHRVTALDHIGVEASSATL